MNFTREPIIETVISTKDGFKIAVRNSKCIESKEYIVDAVEIVSFGTALFFRCREKPNVFLVPVADFELTEVKETRFVLKSSSLDKTIKIHSTKEHLHRSLKEDLEENLVEGGESPGEPSNIEAQDAGSSEGRKKRNRKRKNRSSKSAKETPEGTDNVVNEGDKGGDNKDETSVSSPSSVIPKLLPPPPLVGERGPLGKGETLYEDSFREGSLGDGEEQQSFFLE